MMTPEIIKEAEALGARLARAEMEKNASLADAILGASLSAIAARITAPSDSKDEAVIQGLALGALVGFVKGQESVANVISGAPEKGNLPISPAVASILAGLAVGGGHQVSSVVGKLSNKK